MKSYCDISLLCCIILLATAILTGCQTQVLKSESVEVLKEGTKPTRPYVEVKQLYNVNWSSAENEAMNYFIRKSERLKADAIIILPHENEGFKIYPFGKIGFKYKYKAVAIKWLPVSK